MRLIFVVMGVLGVYGVFSSCWMLVQTAVMAGRVMMCREPGRGANEAPLRSEVGDVEYERWVSEACERYENGTQKQN